MIRTRIVFWKTVVGKKKKRLALISKAIPVPVVASFTSLDDPSFSPSVRPFLDGPAMPKGQATLQATADKNEPSRADTADRSSSPSLTHHRPHRSHSGTDTPALKKSEIRRKIYYTTVLLLDPKFSILLSNSTQ